MTTTCGLTAGTSGSTLGPLLGYEYGKPFTYIGAIMFLINRLPAYSVLMSFSIWNELVSSHWFYSSICSKREPLGIMAQVFRGGCPSSHQLSKYRRENKALTPTSGLASSSLQTTSREHLSCGDCLEGKRGDYLTISVLLCIIIVHIICTAI